MALTATATQGFQPYRLTAERETIHVPGDPGVTYTRGDQCVVTVGEGVLTLGAANEGGVVGRVARTVVAPAATTAFPKPADFDPADINSDAQKCLVEIELNLPSGLPVYLATFKNHFDETVVSYTASTRAVEMTTGFTADDYVNGAIAYVYEGPGIGEVNVVEDYDHTGGAAELLAIFHRPFNATLTTASKMIILAGEAAGSRGTGILGRCESADEDELTVNQGANDGDWVILMDWREAAGHLKNLRVPVIPARYLMLA